MALEPVHLSLPVPHPENDALSRTVEGFQDHFHFEFAAMLPPWCRHRCWFSHGQPT